MKSEQAKYVMKVVIWIFFNILLKYMSLEKQFKLGRIFYKIYFGIYVLIIYISPHSVMDLTHLIHIRKCKNLQLLVDGVKIKNKGKCYFANKLSIVIYNLR